MAGIIVAGAGLISSVFGGNKAAKERERMENYLKITRYGIMRMLHLIIRKEQIQKTDEATP